MGVHEPRKLSINPAFFQEIREDRQELELLLKCLNGMLSDEAGLVDRQQELVCLLQDFRDQLAFHFALEEAYGYFEEALDVAPRLHREAQRLRAQHREFHAWSQQLVEKADAQPPRGIEVLVEAAKALLSALKRHEADEAALIMKALQDDLGGGD
jgi:hypothetical protein